MARVLKPGGRLYFLTPFLVPFHPDPDGFIRPTEKEILRLFEPDGLKCRQIDALGEGILGNAFVSFAHETLPGPLKGPASALIYLVFTWLDRLASLRPRIAGRSLIDRYPVGFFVEFEKTGPAAD